MVTLLVKAEIVVRMTPQALKGQISVKLRDRRTGGLLQLAVAGDHSIAEKQQGKWWLQAFLEQ
jgi:hypothetical protein